jgi:mannose-6-phosphate isomerase-like protein (cupin superfamily)
MQEGVLVRKKEIDNMLANKPTPGKHQLEPLKSLFLAKKIPFGIMEDSRVLNNNAEVHKHEHDLWHCLEGEAEFVYGGRLVDPRIQEGSNGNEILGNAIDGGTNITFKPGDWLWIPAGVAHMHKASNTARMVIIKIPAT